VHDLSPLMNGPVAQRKSNPSSFAALFPDCREAVRRQSEAFDRALALLQRVGLRLHLSICSWCRRSARQIRFMRDAVASSHDHAVMETSAQLSIAARGRLQIALEVREKPATAKSAQAASWAGSKRLQG